MVPLCERLWELRHEQQHTDLMFVTKDGQVFAHRAILAFCCHPLKLILEDQHDIEESVVIAEEFSSADVLSDLEQVYFGRIEENGSYNFAFLDKFGCHNSVVEHCMQPEASMQLPQVSSSKSSLPVMPDAGTSMVLLSAIRKRKRFQQQHVSAKKLQGSSSNVNVIDCDLALLPDDAGTAFVCDLCSEEFFDSGSLETHNDDVHSRIRCQQCQQFVSGVNFASHMKKDHPKSVSCKLCQLVFANRKLYKSHHAVHHAAETCKFCQKKFSDPENKAHHEDNCLVRIHGESARRMPQPCHANPKDVQGDAFHCLHCDTVMKNVRMLKIHFKVQHMHKDAMGMFHCSICNKQMRKIIDHVDIHIDPNYYRHKCSYCERRFRTKLKMAEHTRMYHTREAVLDCKFCDRKFMLTAIRSEHQLTCANNPDRRLPKKKKHKSRDPSIVFSKNPVNPSTKNATSPLDSLAFLKKAVPKEKTMVFAQTIGGSVNDQIMSLLGKK